MKKNNTTYGVIIVPKGTILCNLEKGGDKDGKAGYRFSDSGKRTAKRLVALITGEMIMNDFYGMPWAHTKEGWVKAEDKITWCGSYKEASNLIASLTNRKRKIMIWILIIILITTIGYILYKHYQGRNIISITEPNIDSVPEPIIEPTTEILIPDEIQMD